MYISYPNHSEVLNFNFYGYLRICDRSIRVVKTSSLQSKGPEFKSPARFTVATIANHYYYNSIGSALLGVFWKECRILVKFIRIEEAILRKYVQVKT